MRHVTYTFFDTPVSAFVSLYETAVAGRFVINPSVKACLRSNLRNHLYDLLLIVGVYIYNLMSTTEVEEGVDGVDDALIDSLIDYIHFDDLALEKDVADVDQIEVFCTYYAKHADKAKFKDIRKLQIFELICVCAWESVSKLGHLRYH